MAIAESQSGLDLHRYDWSLFSLIGPVPQRDSLLGLSSNSHNELVIGGQIHAENAVGVGVEESAHWNTAMSGVPNDKHGVFTGISGHQPALIVGASGGSNLIAVALEEALGFLDIVINHTSVGGCVEKLCPCFRSQKVNTLIDVFVEAKDPFKILTEIERSKNLRVHLRTLRSHLGHRCLLLALGSAAAGCNRLWSTFYSNY